MHKKIDINDYSQKIMEALPRGILLNTNGEKFNSMLIGWGHIGSVWNLPAFVIYVRESRYTKAQLDRTGEFTISVPLDEPLDRIIKVCGFLSGRDLDKVKEAGLTLSEPEIIKTPGVKEYPLTLECQIMYSQKQDLSKVPGDIRKIFYPEYVDERNDGSGCDDHTMYIGKIVSSYIIE